MRGWKMKAEHRAALEAIYNETDEVERKLREENASLLSKVVERDVQISLITTDRTSEVANLKADLQAAKAQIEQLIADSEYAEAGPIAFRADPEVFADFEIELEDTEEL